MKPSLPFKILLVCGILVIFLALFLSARAFRQLKNTQASSNGVLSAFAVSSSVATAESQAQATPSTPVLTPDIKPEVKTSTDVVLLNPSPPVSTPAPSPEPNVVSPDVPGLGRHFIDIDFGTKLIQVTSQEDGKACYNAYSYWPSFNKDSTKFFVACDDKAILYSFDPVNFKITDRQTLFANLSGGLPNWQDALWSTASANVLYVQGGLKLWAYNVESRTYTLVKDFSSELSGKYLWQMSKSLDDKRFAFTLKDVKNDYAATAYMVWDRGEEKIIYQKDILELDEVQIDKSGQYLVVKTGLEGKGKVRTQVVDLNTETVLDLTDGAPDFAPGHSDNGTGTLLGYDNWNNSFTIRNLSSPHTYQTVLSLGNDWSQASHISFLANDEDWALVSLYTPGGLKAGKYHDEIILVSTDGSGRVKELAKTHSVIKDYWDMPRANISRDGRFVIFTSNWDGLRRDVFLLKIW